MINAIYLNISVYICGLDLLISCHVMVGFSQLINGMGVRLNLFRTLRLRVPRPPKMVVRATSVVEPRQAVRLRLSYVCLPTCVAEVPT